MGGGGSADAQSARAGMSSSAINRAAIATTAMFALARPIPSRSVSIPIPT